MNFKNEHGQSVLAIHLLVGHLKSLFKLKDQSCVVYREECPCGNNYIGETMQNFNVRKAEHENRLYTSQLTRHLLSNPTHNFICDIIHKEQSLFKKRIIKGLLIAREQPELKYKHKPLSQEDLVNFYKCCIGKILDILTEDNLESKTFLNKDLKLL